MRGSIRFCVRGSLSIRGLEPPLRSAFLRVRRLGPRWPPNVRPTVPSTCGLSGGRRQWQWPIGRCQTFLSYGRRSPPQRLQRSAAYSPEVALVVASNLRASDIRGLLCMCRLLRCAEGLAAERKLHCTQATLDIIAAARLDSEQDGAAEYLASAELRVDPFHGEVTFDELCHLGCCGCCKTGYLPPLGAFLAEWEYLEVPEEHGARLAERIAQQQSGLLPLTMQGGPPSTLTVFEAVAGRYRCDGVPGGKLAALPRVRGAIASQRGCGAPVSCSIGPCALKRPRVCWTSSP